MLPLGILNASTKNVRMTRKSSTDTCRIFVHSQRNPNLDRPRFSSRNASTRCCGVIAREGGKIPSAAAPDSEVVADSLTLMRPRFPLARWVDHVDLALEVRPA